MWVDRAIICLFVASNWLVACEIAPALVADMPLYDSEAVWNNANDCAYNTVENKTNAQAGHHFM